MERERSLFYSSWAFVWKRNTKDVLRSLLSLFRDRPILTFLSVLALVHFSWFSPLIIILAFVFNHLLLELFAKFRVIITQFKIIAGYLDVNEAFADRGLGAEKYLVSDYLGWQYEDIDNWLLKKFTGLMGINAFSINDVVNVFHISSEEVIAANLTCYSTPPLQSYIFFNEPPSGNIGPFQKFSLLHELGHACLFFASGSTYTSHCIKLYLIYFCFLTFLMNWGHPPFFVYISIVAVILSALTEKLFVWAMQRVNDEVFADSFAIGYLDEADVQHLYNLLNRHVEVFRDSELNDAENDIRLRLLKTNLGLMKDGQEDMAIDNSFSRIYKPKFALMGLTCIAVVIPAFYAQPLRGYFLLFLGIATLLTLILFVIVHLFIDALHATIKKRLSDWKPIYKKNTL